MAEGADLVSGEMTNIAACFASRIRYMFTQGKALVRLALFALMLLHPSAVQVLAAEPKRVLILHSFGRDYSPFAEMGNRFRAKLIEGAKQPIDLYEASIFKARFEQSDEIGLVSYLRDVFTTRVPDLIVTLGFPAANFAQKHRQTLFPGAPVVIGLNNRRVSPSWPMQDAVVVSQRVDPQSYIENILQILPDTKTIAVLIGNSPLETYWRGEGEREFSRFAGRVNFIWLNNLSLKQMEEAVAQLPPHSVVLETLVLVDAEGVPHPANRAVKKVRAAANAPSFNYADFEFGTGVVGGRLNQWIVFGDRIAAAAIRILNGEPANSIRFEPLVAGPPTFDWRELQRWNISEARLPPGSVVRFRELTIWEQYRWQLVLIAIALAGQSLLIGALFLERGRRRGAEYEARERLSELAHMNRRAAGGELSASIAHEINQPLAAIVSSGNAGLRWLGNKTPNVKETKDALTRIVSDGHRASEIIQSLREMFKRNTPDKAPLDVNIVIRRLLSFLHFELERNGVSVKAMLTEGMPEVDGDLIQLKQVVMNLIMNAVEAMRARKAGKRILRIRSELDAAGNVIITIQDTGPGMTPEDLARIFQPFVTTKKKGMGMGLSICRTIIKAHGGTLSATSVEGKGSTFQVVLPTIREEAFAHAK